MKTIAKISTDFPSKFGVPRQSGLIEDLKGIIKFEPEFNNPDALRGLDGFSHIWLLWKFNTDSDVWSPTVRPPKLGGNTRMGVFATRSPFRPNSIGLSCVKLESIDGTEITVSGIDLVDGTEIVDIKPYVPYADCRPDAKGGFSQDGTDRLTVIIPDSVKSLLPDSKIKAIENVLSLDPRPQYQNDSNRIYGLEFAGYEIKFKVKDTVLTVVNTKKTIKK